MLGLDFGFLLGASEILDVVNMYNTQRVSPLRPERATDIFIYTYVSEMRERQRLFIEQCRLGDFIFYIPVAISLFTHSVVFITFHPAFSLVTV